MKLLSKDGYGLFVKDDVLYYCDKDKFYKFDSEQIIISSEKEYLLQKYGKENICVDFCFNEVAILKDSSFLCAYFEDQGLRLHSKEGLIQGHLDIDSPMQEGIYGLSLDKNEHIWIAVPTEHYIGCFDIEKEEEIFSISREKKESYTFNNPESIVAIDDFVYVSDMENKRIVKIHIDRFEVEEYKKMEEGIFYYNQIKSKNIYALTSGIYID